MDEQHKIIQNFFKKMSSESGSPAESINFKDAICCYRWKLTTDRENSIWELRQIPRYVLIKTLNLLFLGLRKREFESIPK